MTKYAEFLSTFTSAVQSAKRDVNEIDLIAVSKKKSISEIQEVINQQQFSFGENQLQEIVQKWDHLKKKNNSIKLSYIGNIQSRKVKEIFNYCDLVHTLDRVKIVKLFSDIEKQNKKKLQYFIQVNTGDESQKSGVMMKDAEKFISDCLSSYDLDIIGLMCLPPLKEDPRKHFINLRDLAKNFSLSSLSMGMSNDYKIAIECGSTHLRIGTQIFGERN